MSANQLPQVTREINSTKILEAISGLQAALSTANTLLTEVAGITPVTNVTIDSSSGLATAELQGVGNTGLATISGTLTTISGKVLTDTQLRATPVPVSGTLTVSGVATALNQTNGGQKTQLVDAASNSYESVVGPTGDHYLGVGMMQDVHADANNSSTTNLAAGNTYTFTGIKTSTLGVAGIQVSLFADQNCKVQVQQSPEGTNWDLVDTFYYTASGNFGITVQAISSWVRVVVTTNSLTTTTFRLQTALCPVVEALPRSLDPNGNLRVAAPVDALGFGQLGTPMGEVRVAQPVRLVGTAFDGTTIDARFWTTAAAGTAATIAQASNQILLTSGTSNGATVTMFSVRRARYVSGSGMRYRAIVQASAGVANNVRKWGVGWGASMPTVTDGAWFQMNGAALELVVMKATTPTTVTSFNGNWGATLVPGTSARTWEIYYTSTRVLFVLDGVLLHSHSAAAATWSSTKTLHSFADSVNSGVLAGSETLAVRVASVYRLGLLNSEAQYYNLTGNAATHVIKLGAGKLHKLIFNNTSGTSFVIYDNTAASGSIIGKITTATAALGSWDYQCPFFNGLTIITTGNSLDMTVVYE